ncbi:ParA family protein [Streptomyces marianii]|uniref:ParA family protein n=1 Tax=Streptomyces marianii TaxID=1817406 RepID=A0A5R9DVA3_9ACTN|nr:ParA family protein [Streptomyces marianii]TLQ38962.1 ParA family protein [Streptomyces marianii]
MPMTVLEPLGGLTDPLDVVREWRVDELLGAADLDAALEQLDYNRDLRAQIYVPPSLGEFPAAFAGEHRVYVCVNQKGGAGKTTTSVELACAWVAMGYTVRLIDADPQDASLSAWLTPVYGDTPEGERFDLTDVMFNRRSLDEATYYTNIQGLYIVPSGETLGQVEYDPKAGRDGSLRGAIRKSKAPVDITIIDAPPALGKLSINGLIAADEVIVPLKVGALDKKALKELHDTIRAVQDDANPDLFVRAAVMTAWDKSKFAGKVAAQLRTDYPEAIVAPVRRSVKAAEAPDHGVPVRVFHPAAKATGDYDQLARTLLPAKGATAA